MAPPPVPLRHYADASVITARQVTEDTPPDLLQGSMKLKVTLPSGKQTNINVHRSTPMMDVLVQVTSAHKITPGNHAIRVICNNRNISYKPSTAVGSLDISAIEIVSKTSNGDESRKDYRQSKDKKVRLKVNLPRNQLAVYRLPPKTLISEVLSMVCEDKNLKEDLFEIRHPVNVDERLRGSCSLSDYQLQEVCIVSKNYRAPPLSVNDLFAMSSLSHHHEDRKRRGFRAFFSRKNKHNTGSLSSGSTGDRSDSPENEAAKMQSSSRLSLNMNDCAKFGTNDQKIFRPTSLVNLSKDHRKRPAPMPPQSSTLNGTFTNGNSAAISCHDLSIDDVRPSLTPTSSELGEEIRTSSRSSSRNMNSPIGELAVLSRIKRKAPLPPPTTSGNTEEVVSSHDKDSSMSPSPDLQIMDGDSRSNTPSEVSIDVRPSSSEVSDVIQEEDDQQGEPPLSLIHRRTNSSISNSGSLDKDTDMNESVQQPKDSSSGLESANVDESSYSAIPNESSHKEALILSDSIGEDNSSKSLETLDRILDKAEADLNEFSSIGLMPNGDMNDLNKHESNSQLIYEETNDLISNEELSDLKTIPEESVAEAVNEIWKVETSEVMKDVRQCRVKFKENEVERYRNESSENQTLLFNFLEKNSRNLKKKVYTDETLTYKFIPNSSASSTNEDENRLYTSSTSNYNVILKMTPQPKPRTEMGRKSPSSDSNCSYYSFKTESETKSRSNTDASYESVPPPLPSQPIPELNELDDVRSDYSIVSSSSSNDDIYRHHEDFGESTSKYSNDPKQKVFSISTYTNRDHKRSYTKRLTRSESLQEISPPLHIDKNEARTSSLQRNQSVKSDAFKITSTGSSNSLDRSHRFRIAAKETFEKTPKIIEETIYTDSHKMVAEDNTNKMIKPPVPFRVSKWYQEFNKEYIGPRKLSNLRKTKSTADIRINDGQQQAGVSDPGLAQEYVKLQNDFMKWQNQLMQNQNVLHNKVAPIAAPNMMMNQNMQTPFNMEPEPPKRREINIPIRMESDDESIMNQTSSFSTTDSIGASNLGQQQGVWNATTPNVTMGSWKDRPSNVECVVVTDPPQVFQAPDDKRFMPVFIRREINPSVCPEYVPAADHVFTGTRFEPPNIGMNSRFNSSPNKPQYSPMNSQYASQPNFNESPTVNNSFPTPPSSEIGTNSTNEGNFTPRFSNSQKKHYINSDPNESDHSNGKFSSVINLSNDKESNISPKRGISAQFNNVGRTPASVTNSQLTLGNNSNNGSSNRSNTWNKSPSPEKVSVSSLAKESFSPMSSRLVQAASNQPSTTKPTLVTQYPSTYVDNSLVASPKFDTRLAQPSTNFDSRRSPKPQTFEPMPTQQSFPPMPKFEPEQEPMRISPPRRQKKSPSPVKQEMPPPHTIHSYDNRSSPIREQLIDSFASMKLPSAVIPQEHLMTQSSVVPPPPVCGVPPPPPPPPPRIKPEIRRTSTGKKIISSNQTPELDAREELMMAIRKFGGSGHLHKPNDSDY